MTTGPSMQPPPSSNVLRLSSTLSVFLDRPFTAGQCFHATEIIGRRDLRSPQTSPLHQTSPDTSLEMEEDDSKGSSYSHMSTTSSSAASPPLSPLSTPDSKVTSPMWSPLPSSAAPSSSSSSAFPFPSPKASLSAPSAPVFHPRSFLVTHVINEDALDRETVMSRLYNHLFEHRQTEPFFSLVLQSLGESIGCFPTSDVDHGTDIKSGCFVVYKAHPTLDMVPIKSLFEFAQIFRSVGYAISYLVEFGLIHRSIEMAHMMLDQTHPKNPWLVRLFHFERVVNCTQIEKNEDRCRLVMADWCDYLAVMEQLVKKWKSKWGLTLDQELEIQDQLDLTVDRIVNSFNTYEGRERYVVLRKKFDLVSLIFMAIANPLPSPPEDHSSQDDDHFSLFSSPSRLSAHSSMFSKDV